MAFPQGDGLIPVLLADVDCGVAHVHRTADEEIALGCLPVGQQIGHGRRTGKTGGSLHQFLALDKAGAHLAFAHACLFPKDAVGAADGGHGAAAVGHVDAQRGADGHVHRAVIGLHVRQEVHFADRPQPDVLHGNQKVGLQVAGQPVDLFARQRALAQGDVVGAQGRVADNHLVEVVFIGQRVGQRLRRRRRIARVVVRLAGHLVLALRLLAGLGHRRRLGRSGHVVDHGHAPQGGGKAHLGWLHVVYGELLHALARGGHEQEQAQKTGREDSFHFSSTS